MSATSVELPTVEAPQSLSYQFFKFTFADKLMAMVLGCVTLIVWVKLAMLGLLIGLGVTICLLWTLDWSRRYYSYGEAVYGQWIHRVRKDVLWEKKDQAQNKRKTWFKPSEAIPLGVDDAGGIGLVWNDLRKEYSVLISSSGSDITGMNVADQQAMQTVVSETIRRVSVFEKLRVKVGFALRRRPYDIRELDEAFDASMHPDIFVPEALVLSSQTGLTPDELYKAGRLSKDDLRRARLHRLNAQARSDAQQNGARSDMITVITVSRSTRFKLAAKGKPLSPKELERENIVQLAREVLSGLERASVHRPQILGPEACKEYIRAAWDIYGPENTQDERTAPTDEEEPQEGRASYSPKQRILVTDGSCKMDGTWHAVIRVTSLPKHIHPLLMPQLFTSDVRWVSRSLVSEASSGNAEYRRAAFLGAAYEEIMSKLRIGAKSRKRMGQLQEREEDLANQGHVEYFNIFLSAASDDPEKLEDEVDQLIRAVKTIGGKAERVTGRCRQRAAALTAATAIALL